MSVQPFPNASHSGNPADLARQAQSIIHKSINEELGPSDRLIAQSAEDKLMSHARRGFWLGTFVGGLVAFRSRWMAGRNALRKGALPRLFFPSAEQGPGSLKAQLEAAKKAAAEDAKAGAKAAEDNMRQGKGAFFAKAIGFGILGSVVGTQLGLMSGRAASNRILENSGRKDAINAALERGLQRAQQELSKVPGGANIRLSRGGATAEAGAGQGRELASGDNGVDGVGYGEPGQELKTEGMSDGVGYSDRAPPQDQFPGSLSDPSIPSPASSSSSSGGPSRWDELRRSRAAPPSKWDELRQERGRAAVPPPSSPNEQQEDRGEQELLSGRDSQGDRERRRREFEALFEKEARGGDDSLSEKAWK
ncbi:hypothetical protein JCM10207_008098 [Rhodosporidiobolus poonsookiae]